MATGPGKYEHACTQARLLAKAETVVLIVVNGEHGNGFSVQSPSPEFISDLPAILRQLADSIQLDLTNQLLRTHKPPRTEIAPG